jgi:hypothetical protein
MYQLPMSHIVRRLDGPHVVLLDGTSLPLDDFKRIRVSPSLYWEMVALRVPRDPRDFNPVAQYWEDPQPEVP